MPKKVLLFLAQGFEELEASAFTDVMGWSREHGIEGVELYTTALHPEIRGTWNLIVRPELLFNEIKQETFDALAIPGGFETAGFYSDAYDERLLSLIRDFDKENKIVASICVGALPIAKSGTLRNRKATTYDLSKNVRREELANLGATLSEGPLVVDQNIITSTGPATALDVAFTLLALLTSQENVLQVKKFMRFI